MSGLQISVPGHARWLPLPLEGDIDAQAAAAARELTGGARRKRVKGVAALIAGTARAVARQAELMRQADIPTFLAWAFLPGPGVLEPGPVALLRGLPLAADATDDDVVATVVDVTEERYGGIDVEPLDTASGRALVVRWRPVVRAEDGTEAVHEQRAVLWPKPSMEVVLVLSIYVLDLADGAAAAVPLSELAAGLRWSLS